MSYAVRNTLFIAAFWSLLLGISFYYVYGIQRPQIKELLTENMSRKARIQELGRLQQDRSGLQIEYDRLKELGLGKKGFIAAHETPGETYDYIQRELRRRGSSLQINLRYEQTDQYLGIDRRTYEFAGNGAFSDFYYLIWFLENGPLFYDIQSLRVERMILSENELHQSKKGDIDFSMKVAGYNRNEGPDITQISVGSAAPQPIANLVTNRAVKISTPESVDKPADKVISPEKIIAAEPNHEGLAEINSKSTVLAVTSNSALVRDQRGKMMRLRRGDRIFQGRVAEINPSSGQVIFEIAGPERPMRISLSTIQN